MKTQLRFYTTTALIMLYALLAGCSPDPTSLVVKSEPDGAYITANDTGAALGTAPVKIEYDKAKLLKKANKDDKAGCYRVKGFKARWISGATAASTSTIRLCDPVGKSFTVTLQRNTKDPDLEKDLQFARQDKDLQIQQQQAITEKQQSKAPKPPQ